MAVLLLCDLVYGRASSFSTSDVALLISAIEQALERLYRANDDVGGKDPELLEYGRRYSLLLEKLQAVAKAG